MSRIPKFINYGFKWWWNILEKILRGRKLKKELRNRKKKTIGRWRKKIIRGIIRRIIRWRWALRKNDERRDKFLKKKTINGITKRSN